MKCENCGFESPQEYPQCPACQAPLANLPQAGVNPILAALKDQLFLAICILMSASCLLSLSMDSVPLIHILITVFLWLTYAQSRKDVADAEHLRCVSGAVYAQYVIVYVAAGLCLLAGVIFAVSFSFLTDHSEYIHTLLSGFSTLDSEELALIKNFASLSSIVFLVVFAIASAIIVLVNIFILRFIHRFAKSIYQSVEANKLELKHTNTAKICLYILSGCSAISALSSLGAFLPMLSSAVSCATTLIAALLIQKYFQVNE